jgi:hypothetical protein
MIICARKKKHDDGTREYTVSIIIQQEKENKFFVHRLQYCVYERDL